MFIYHNNSKCNFTEDIKPNAIVSLQETQRVLLQYGKLRLLFCCKAKKNEEETLQMQHIMHETMKSSHFLKKEKNKQFYTILFFILYTMTTNKQNKEKKHLKIILTSRVFFYKKEDVEINSLVHLVHQTMEWGHRQEKLSKPSYGKRKHRHNSRFKRLFLFQYKGESLEIIQKQVASIHEKNAFDVALDPSSCLSMLSEWKEK